MARASGAVTFAILVVLASIGYGQQVSQTDSDADAARQQKQSKSEPKTPAKKKVYTNADVVPSDAAAGKDTQANPLGSDAGQPAAVKSTEAQGPGGSRSSVFDRPKQNSPETIVVPAGTKITVDISEENPPRNLSLHVHSGKVVNIVQVGSTVVIPALSKVTIQDSVGMMELNGVTIDGIRYELQTDRVLLQQGSMSEATFTLKRDFTIKR
jgi:hypothetical protein